MVDSSVGVLFAVVIVGVLLICVWAVVGAFAPILDISELAIAAIVAMFAIVALAYSLKSNQHFPFFVAAI